ncbi:MAG: hypothetical protein K940chlam2_01248 [Chlamydiae bacterium]|nr:hypothetical protein [Chlamydiota bacterium]
MVYCTLSFSEGFWNTRGMQQLANLTRQTLIHLQDRFDPARRIPSVAVFKAERPKEAPAPAPKKVAPPPAPKKVEPPPAPLLDQPKREEKKQDHSELREQISDLLPHMRLLEKPLERGPVALICFYDDELAFYKALAGAIHKNLAPVKLLSGKGTLPFLDHYRLVIAPEKAAVQWNGPLITTSAANLYEENRAAKKELWDLLCQKLKL